MGLVRNFSVPARPEGDARYGRTCSTESKRRPETVAGGAVEQGSNAVNGEQPEKKQPKIKIDEEIYDFGVMEDSRIGHHEFIFENVGNAPLKIEVAAPLVNVPRVRSRKSGSIRAKKRSWFWNGTPEGYTGDFAQTATISTTDPERPSISLKVKGGFTLRWH